MRKPDRTGPKFPTTGPDRTGLKTRKKRTGIENRKKMQTTGSDRTRPNIFGWASFLSIDHQFKKWRTLQLGGKLVQINKTY